MRTNEAGILGIILAGGLSRRMEGPEKSLLEIAGKTLVEIVRDRLVRQADSVILNANGDADRFAAMNIPVVADTVENYAGPLAGILAGMQYAREELPQVKYVVSVAADTPFFPDDLVQRFINAHNEAAEKTTRDIICLANSGGHRHPVFGLWPIKLADDLEHFLDVRNERKVMFFVNEYQRVDVPFEEAIVHGSTIDPFFNINTPEDFQTARSLLERNAA